MKRYLGLISVAALLFFTKDLWPDIPSPNISRVLAETSQETSILPVTQPLTTQSRFTEQITEQTEVISKKTVYKDDPQTEAGEETILEEGEDGKKVTTTKTTYYLGEEFDKEVVSTKITNPKDKVVLRGTKIVWKTLDTPQGQIKYWKKMTVYATHYDSHCPGCDQWTATGMRAGKGVIAVDPKVIPLFSKVYVPGYGLAIAGDTGGAIKGNRIDLGFDNAKTAGWGAKYIDIYLL